MSPKLKFLHLIFLFLNCRYDVGVQQFGCWAINNLALAGEDVRRKLRKAGVIEVCRMALETHPDDAEVTRQARSALGLLGGKKSAPGVAPFT